MKKSMRRNDNKEVRVMLAPPTFDQSRQPAGKSDASGVIVEVV